MMPTSDRQRRTGGSAMTDQHDARLAAPPTPWPRCCARRDRAGARHGRRRGRSTTPRCGARSNGWPAQLARRRAGAERPDRASCCRTGRRWPWCCWRRCAVGCAAPLNPKYREDEFRFYLDDLHAAALVTVDGADARRARRRARRARSPSTLRGEGLAIDLVAPAGRREHRRSTERPSPTTRRSCCTPRARRRDRRSCRCASATWPGRRATSPRRCSSRRPTARST